MKMPDAGFSLLELAAVLGLVAIAATVAIIQLNTSITLMDADQAANLVSSQMRYSRQVAVDQRRDVLLQFVNPNRITVVRQDDEDSQTVLADVTLPDGYTFGQPTVGGDTPDGYGFDEPVTFGGEEGGTFLGDGVFINSGGVVVNGTVFTIGPGNGTARAVTLNGASARTKQYYLRGTAWVER
jgi:prepilin-type N-terminal cleavage/methylation domain-containing protein